MRWLHRFQQQLGLTKNEGVALLSLSVLLSIGLVARHVQQRTVLVSDGAYEEMDRLFFERAADSLRNDTDAEPVVIAPPDAERLIDVNTADQEELERLPRIGPRLAARVIAFRTTYGPFRVVEDLAQVSGIGPRTVEGLRPYVTLSADTLHR